MQVKDLHRHFIDHLEIPSRQGKGMLRRDDAVFDCWFESGSMPYGQNHYPFENKEFVEVPPPSPPSPPCTVPHPPPHTHPSVYPCTAPTSASCNMRARMVQPGELQCIGFQPSYVSPSPKSLFCISSRDLRGLCP